MGGPRPSDPESTKNSRALLHRLHDQAGNGVFFGHQDTSAYGVWWKCDEKRSDLKDAIGSWPAVYGWDLGGITSGKEENIDGVKFTDIAKYIYEVDKRGGINTVSLHQHNPVSGGNVFDSTPAVSSILEDGELYVPYLSVLDCVADFHSELRRDDGTLIPIVLRPYHEHNQDWPWWRCDSDTQEQFVQLWRMTVDYLREKRGMHQILYCYAPQDVSNREEYLVGYPGNAYVDILGLDFYKVWEAEQINRFGEALSMINRFAEERGKVAALTKTGVENIPIGDWWTSYLLAAIESDEYSKKTVWVLVWRNANEEHYFAPFEGHPRTDNFLEMISSKRLIMGATGEQDDFE